ncbi:MAG: DUF3488 and transglutaminase-like domain-containing protein [Phycisphaerae bacterium]|nr:DUF3488 and transglutaminase-like domain-containing protein [Phycisphaerae bacterium]
MPLASFTQAEILLTERRRLEQPLLLLMLIGTVTFSIAEGNWFYVLSSTLAIVVNFIAMRQNMEIYVERKLVNLGVITATCVALLEYIHTDQMAIVTIGHFMILIQLCKLFERKRIRDYVQLLTLNILLLVTTALICSALWFSFVTVIYLMLALYVGMVLTLKRGLDAAAAVTLPGEVGPLEPRKVAWNVVRDWPGRALRRTMLFILLPALVGSLLAFILAPRAADRLMGYVGQQLLDVGFDPIVRLGGRKDIYLSDRVIMRVRIYRGQTPGQASGDSERYLRAGVLDTYSHSTWRKIAPFESTFEKHSRDQFEPRTVLPRVSESLMASTVRHEVSMVSLGMSNLAVPYPTVKLRLHAGSADATLDLAYKARRNYGYNNKIQYTTYSFTHPLNASQLAWLRQPRMEGYDNFVTPRVFLPSDTHQRILTLAKQWCQDLLDKRQSDPANRNKWNMAIAARIQQKLRDEYDYTLDISDSDMSRDGVEDFLFYLQKGHCEYFASALAVMCNLLDVPARVAMGFTLNEYDEAGKQYTVRERDAHAWCEVYSQETDWRILDATPALAQQRDEQGFWAWLGDFWQDIRFFWYQKVVGYDTSTQDEMRTDMIDWLFGGLRRFWEWIKALGRSVGRIFTHGTVDRILVNFLMWFAGAVAVVLAVVSLRRVRWRIKRVRRAPADDGRKFALLFKFLAMLERRGFAATPGDTLRERVCAAGEQFSLPAGLLEQMAELQYQWRWGDQAPAAETQRQAEKNFQTLSEHLTAHGKKTVRKQKVDRPGKTIT